MCPNDLPHSVLKQDLDDSCELSQYRIVSSLRTVPGGGGVGVYRFEYSFFSEK